MPRKPLPGATLGERIRSARLRAKMTGADVAKACGVDAPQLSRIESGQTMPGAAMMLAICAAIGLRVGELEGLS